MLKIRSIGQAVQKLSSGYTQTDKGKTFTYPHTRAVKMLVTECKSKIKTVFLLIATLNFVVVAVVVDVFSQHRLLAWAIFWIGPNIERVYPPLHTTGWNFLCWQ